FSKARSCKPSGLPSMNLKGYAIDTGSVVPEGAITGNVGQFYGYNLAGADAILYLKTAGGKSTTGWLAYGHPGRAIRKGTVSVLITDLTKTVTFEVAFLTTAYQVFLQPLGNLTVNVWPSGLLTTGFTLNLSVGIVGTFNYLAVED